jgi:hypothetical protein
MGLATAYDELEGGDIWDRGAGTDTLIKRYSYLKSPDKVRTALINMHDRQVALARIKRVLEESKRKEPEYCARGPDTCDDIEYAPRKYPHATHSLLKHKPADKPPPPEFSAETIKQAVANLNIGDIKPEPKPAPKSASPRARVPQHAQQLINQVAREMSLCRKDVVGPSRWRAHVECRAVIILLLRERNSSVYSYPEIGRILGGRDHSSIHNAVKMFDIYCRRSPGLFELYKRLGGQRATP